MTRSLEDKVAIVTGAGRGLGKAFALKYAEEGARLLLPDIRSGAGREDRRGDPQRRWAGGGHGDRHRRRILHAGRCGQGAVALRESRYPAQQRRAEFRCQPAPWDTWTVDLWNRCSPSTPGGRGSCAGLSRPSCGAGARQNHQPGLGLRPVAPWRPTPLCLQQGGDPSDHPVPRPTLGPSGICVNSIAPGLTETEATLALSERQRSRRDRSPAVRQATRGTARPGWSRRLLGLG